MDEPILQTRLQMPPLRAVLVKRPRLFARLAQNLPLTLVSAPAGFGKTTLLSQYVTHLSRPVAWLSLDEALDDPARFWTHVIAACRSVVEGFGDAALVQLDTPAALPAETIPTILINELAGQEQPLTLVLDDYHAIRDPAIQDSVAFLAEHLPRTLQLILCTRVDPPWPLARFRARHQLAEIRAHDLRFSAAEAAVFFSETMGISLSPADVETLEARTEGWVAGLQLAALALQALPPRPDGDATADFVQAFAGSHLFIAEYLLEEVLARQSSETQTFLLQTCLLERLQADLCDAVTGLTNGRDMLDALHRANLFLVPLDAAGQWYRYHHLFADLLQARLSQTLPAAVVADLHLRATGWYEQNRFVDAAVRHALAARAYERVAALIEREARAMMFSGRANALRSWLAALPLPAFQSHPRLQIYRLWIDLMQERVDLSASALREKEALLRNLPPSPENERLQVELLAVLCRFVAFAGDTDRAIQLADEALARLPETEPALRARAYSALAVAHWIDGRGDQARQAHDACMPLARAVGNDTLAAHALLMKGLSQVDDGRLHAAARTYRAILALGEDAGQEIFFPAGQGHIGLAGLYLEWNALDTAEAHLQQGMTLCRQGGLAGLSTGHVHSARLHQARGDFAAAAAELAQLGETGVDPSGTARQILLAIAMGDLDRAVRFAAPWLRLLEEAGPRPPLLIQEIALNTLARLHLALGNPDQAAELLDVVETSAEPADRRGRLIEVHLFRTLVALARSHDRSRGRVPPAARRSLERALTLARPAGYTLLFLEECPTLVPVLEAIANRSAAPAALPHDARRLLDAWRARTGAATAVSAVAAALADPLTPREREVLQLLARGDSNQAIADSLVITVRTVKKHVTNILGKLGVSNRTQAVARARELGLIASE